jgi:hypothetical protein
MSRVIRIVVRISIAVVVICVIAAVAMIWIAGRGMCGNTILSESPSPDGRFRAIVFDRSCGAVSHGSSTQVSVLARSEVLPNAAGDAFVGHLDSGIGPVGTGDAEVKVTWISKTDLQVAYHARSRVALARQAIAGITVKYAVLP